ncbi:UDP-N-acetylmuramate--L-alanine ligase [Rarobacter faecitabidus]|uniref:UDP-N-acetylmuramate--L-alanine ligase n=1 Tax=Rarobacter faecitabidus TaxID=13243 RepID=A0A542ZWJ6_RARFA|nr:UDP-N-acetylmuramate--L-alanine ligase [Rarobacter faecitabidus]TQL64616.1 UDP-N-acetylmuramate--L-alanine ligase [Rarobacter faecitabidus]
MTGVREQQDSARYDAAWWGRVHLIAIGGAGMSVIAAMLLEQGVSVQGSDANDSAGLRALGEAGATTWVGHDASHVDGADTVVVSSAIKESNPELAAARARGLRVLHRSEALAALARGRSLVAVAGAHGKTTTSAMIATALRGLGADPSFAIGSTIATATGMASGGHSGSDALLVIEADESDGSFLNYSPTIAVVNNIEPDHLDHYGTAEALYAAFDAFAERVVAGGTLVLSADDPGTRALAERSRARWAGQTPTHRRVVTFGTDPAADYVISFSGSGSDVHFGDRVTRLELTVPGEHNLRNATGALAAIVELGFDADEAAAAIGAFRGTGRRFEFRGEANEVRVFDDYAHHPTEVAAVLAAARQVAGEGRVIVLFQPHLYSRTVAFAREFAEALQLADVAVVSDVYAAREAPRSDVGARTITDLATPGSGVAAVPDLATAARTVATEASPGDLVLLVGAGSVTAMAGEVLRTLAGDEGL